MSDSDSLHEINKTMPTGYESKEDRPFVVIYRNLQEFFKYWARHRDHLIAGPEDKHLLDQIQKYPKWNEIIFIEEYKPVEKEDKVLWRVWWKQEYDTSVKRQQEKQREYDLERERNLRRKEIIADIAESFMDVFVDKEQAISMAEKLYANKSSSIIKELGHKKEVEFI